MSNFTASFSKIKQEQVVIGEFMLFRKLLSKNRNLIAIKKSDTLFLKQLLRDYLSRSTEYIGHRGTKDFFIILEYSLTSKGKRLVDNLAISYWDKHVPKIKKLVSRERIRDYRSDFLNESFIDRMDTIYRYEILQKRFIKEIALILKNDSQSIIPKNNSFEKRLSNLKKIFSFNNVELEIILFLYAISTCAESRDYFGDTLRLKDIDNSLGMLSKITSIEITAAAKALGPKSKLIQVEFVNDDLTLDSSLRTYLSGYNEGNFLDNFLKHDKNLNPLPLENFPIPKNDLDLIKKLLSSKRRANILLYGEPGTGKTELAKSIAKCLGKDLYFISQEELGQKETIRSVRLKGLHAAKNVLDHTKSIIVVDECDSLINTYMSFFYSGNKNDKCWLNDYLESGECHIIWISNDMDRVEDSVKRRFSYSQKFSKFTKRERLLVWDNLKLKHNILSTLLEDDFLKLSEKFTVNAGPIALALEDIVAINPEIKRPELLLKIESILSNHQILISGKKPNTITSNSKNYSLEGLTVKNANLEEITTDLKTFLSMLETGDCPIFNMNLLLSGPPGTGKTEFARFIGRELGRELVSKKASDLLSMWVGGTEKLIKETFEEAERSNAVLFLDEADSLLHSRQSAQRSWEVTQVNELLCQMENFKGIFICATNFKDNLDSASLRRFNFKIEFDYLDNFGKELFFNRLLSDLIKIPLSDKDKNALYKIPRLTPGDFKVVWQKNIFNC